MDERSCSSVLNSLDIPLRALRVQPTRVTELMPLIMKEYGASSCFVIAHVNNEGLLSTGTNSALSSSRLKLCVSNQDITKALAFLPLFDLEANSLVFVVPDATESAPMPLIQALCVASNARGQGSGFRIILMDVGAGNVKPLYDEAGNWGVRATPLVVNEHAGSAAADDT